MEILRAIQAALPAWAFEVFKLGNGLLLLLLIFVPLERLAPARAPGRRRWSADILYYFLNSLLPPKLIVLAVVLVVWAMRAGLPHGLFPALADLPQWTRFVLALLVAEIGFYWGHRWMHASSRLWKFHALHHSASDMTWLVNTRAHPVDLTLTRLCGLLPLYVLGISRLDGATVDTLPLLVALVMNLWGYLIHANVRFNLRPLQSLIATPAFHHWHHECVAGDAAGSGHGHSNFAAMLPLLDRLFGTYREAGTARPQRFGTDTPVPDAVVDQVMAPFMPLHASSSG